MDHDEWNTWLGRFPSAQITYPQSADWGECKRADGWSVERVGVRRHGELEGGFQLFWRQKRGRLRIGYISRGPLVLPELSLEEVGPLVTTALLRLVSERRLEAVLCQPAPSNQSWIPHLQDAGFVSYAGRAVDRGDLYIDVTGGPDRILSRMDASTRKKIRQGTNRGVEIHEGGPADLELFFRLMSQTCRRHGSEPNPVSAVALQHYWDVLSTRYPLRLTLARVGNRVTAGLITLKASEDLCIQWKKGDDGVERNRRPNEALAAESLLWAGQMGFRRVGFAGCDRRVLLALKNHGTPLIQNARRYRDAFKAQFGGQPVFFPEPQIYFRRPMARRMYGWLTRWTAARGR